MPFDGVYQVKSCSNLKLSCGILQILGQLRAIIKMTKTADFVAELARQHNITHVRTGDRALAELITNLADDDVKADATEDLLVALKIAGVIDGSKFLELLGRHLDERHALK